MSSDVPLVSVILPVLGAERLGFCLDALGRQTQRNHEIIVVDNGSPGGLEPLTESVERCRLIRERQRGAYAARNAGLRVAQGQLLAFTDADCVPAPDWIERGVAALRANPDCGLVGGRIEITVANRSNPNAFELYELHTSFRQREYVERWNFAATANLFTRRDVIDAVGPFDPLIVSMGDREWGSRVHQAGYRLVYAHDTRIVHPARASLGSLWSRTARTTGGFLTLIQKKDWSLRSIARDMPMGMLPVSHSRRDREDLSLPDRARILSVSALVLGVRAVETVRLLLGGERVHL